MPSSELAVLEGALAVQAVLDTRSRPVVRIDIARGSGRPPIIRAVDTARRQGIPVRIVDQAELDQRVAGRTHGGILAVVGARRFTSPERLGEGMPSPFLALLDGVEDPYSFGQSIRTLYAAGAHGLLVRRSGWSHTEAVVVRASAGASERMPTAVVEDSRRLLEVVRMARSRGLPIVCAHRSAGLTVYQADLSGPLLLAVGGARRGLTRAFVDAADVLVSIPYGRPFRPALDTTSATAALAFEIARQRGLARGDPMGGAASVTYGVPRTLVRTQRARRGSTAMPQSG